MIVYQNNKIIGISKKLLNQLNVDLYSLSETITQIDLQISSLKNEPITINNEKYEVEEIELISNENIKVFNLKTIQTSKKEFSFTPKIEEPTFEEIKIQPLNIEELQKEELKEEPIKIEEISISEQAPQTIQPLQLDFTESKTEEKPQEIKPKEKDEYISVSFENEFEEIEKLLNAPKDEAIKEIEKELIQASKDLEIDINTLKELKDELFEMFKTEKEEFIKAVKEKDYEKIHKIAHKLKGAALNLRLTNIASVLKKIDELSRQKISIDSIEHLVNKFYEFLEKIEIENKNNAKIPEHVKILIKQTIQNYLETQNEKKFNKDKKYIEKVLNVQINSINDLENLLKDS